MKILVTSLPDLKKIHPQRYHHLLKYLSQKHKVTMQCVNAWWLKESQDEYLKEIFKKLRFYYLSERKINPVLQELSVLWDYTNFRNKVNLKEFDVHINFNSLIAGYFVAKRLKALGIPTVFDICDDLIEWIKSSQRVPHLLKSFGRFVGKFMLKKNISLVEHVTYVTNSLKESYKFPSDKSVLIPNGVDTELFRPYPSQELKGELDISQDFVIGFVGVLSEWVDLEPIFHVLRLLGNALKIKMLIVGGGEKVNSFKELAREYQISNMTIFIGNVPYTQVPQYISCMDACLIPFRVSAVGNNALPLKLFEYMACERPVVSTNLNGIKEAVGDRVLYFSNAEELEQRILELYHNEELRRKLGQEGRKFVEQNYSWDKICRRFEEVLIEVAQFRRREERV